MSSELFKNSIQELKSFWVPTIWAKKLRKTTDLHISQHQPLPATPYEQSTSAMKKGPGLF